MVSFHASNDMLVRTGLEKHVQSYEAGYCQDGILNPANDPVGAAKILGDEEFATLRSRTEEAIAELCRQAGLPDSIVRECFKKQTRRASAEEVVARKAAKEVKAREKAAREKHIAEAQATMKAAIAGFRAAKGSKKRK